MAVILFFASIIAIVFGWVALGWLAGEKVLEAFKAREVLPIVAVIIEIRYYSLSWAKCRCSGVFKVVIGFLGLRAIVFDADLAAAHIRPFRQWQWCL